jgi:type II secretory pathway component PulF
MPQTYAYKVRDKAGNLVTGELIGDNEGLVMRKLREMGV